jgi:SagB-type dehydrogenase family enzyme
MAERLWEKALLPQVNEDLVWELFHENSKNGHYSSVLSKEEIQASINELHESLPFENYPIVDLPDSILPLSVSLGEAITSRASSRDMEPCPLSLSKVATILHYAYGVTRDNTNTSLSRPLRAVPSGGALYPLEMFFHTAYVEGLRPGLYHYNPCKRHLRFLNEVNETNSISKSLLQPELAHGASIMVFITAVFERSVFKYQDRGYRYILLEAGHAAQNINLVATALGLECVNIGGFFDREVDEFLDLDGVTHSTIYMIAVGRKAPQV